MNPIPLSILESIGTILAAIVGGVVGHWFSKQKKFWFIGYLIPFVFMVFFAMARRMPRLEFEPPFSWLMMGRTEFVLYCVFAPMLLLTMIGKLKHRWQHTAVITILVGSVGYFSSPFWLPLVVYSDLVKIKTKVDRDGICLQSNGYTCGPASSVTVLQRLGFLNAKEGDLAIRMKTTPLTGTPPDSLCLTLNEIYGDKGLTFEFRFFKTLDDLQAAGLAIPLMKWSVWADHYMVLLSMSDENVVLGDPLAGRSILSRERFSQMWRHSAVVVKLRGKVIRLYDRDFMADLHRDFWVAPATTEMTIPSGKTEPQPRQVQKPQWKVIYAIVALCDNENQGIVKVPAALGNGDAPDSNLYWGAQYGLKTVMCRSPGWKTESTRQYVSTDILERIVLSNRSRKALLVADAYKGSKIKTAMETLLAVATGDQTIDVSGRKLRPDLVIYVGHNGLFDFSLNAPVSVAAGTKPASMVLACKSRPSIGPLLTNTGSRQVLMTNGFMAPEGYVVEAGLNSWLAGSDVEDIADAAATAYSKYQKHCSKAAALRLFEPKHP